MSSLRPIGETGASIEAIPPTAPDPESTSSRIRIRTLDELLSAPPVEPLVPELIAKESLVFLYGLPSSGKSYLALHLSCCIAAGHHFFGHALEEGEVLYVAAEGAAGLRRRLLAIVQGVEGDVMPAVKSNLHLITDAIPMADEAEELIQSVGESDIHPSLIVLDTLARCAGGLDENSATEMGRFIAACDRIRTALHATVMVVHHTGKEGDSERGSSALRGAADSMFKVHHDGDLRVLVNDKQKDLEEHRPLRFELVSTVAEWNEDQQPLSACFVQPVEGDGDDAERGEQEALVETDRKILDALQEYFFEDGASTSELIAAAGVSKTAFHRRKKILVERGALEHHGSGHSTRYALPARGEAGSPSPDSGAEEPEESHVSGDSQEGGLGPTPTPLGGGSGTLPPQELQEGVGGGSFDEEAPDA